MSFLGEDMAASGITVMLSALAGSAVTLFLGWFGLRQKGVDALTQSQQAMLTAAWDRIQKLEEALKEERRYRERREEFIRDSYRNEINGLIQRIRELESKVS